MKKILLLIFCLLILVIPQSISATNDNPVGYSKLFSCEKWVKIDTNDCNIEIFYNNNNIGEIDFLVKSENSTISDYTIYLYDIFGRKIFEKDIKYPSSFSEKGINQGMYYLKVSNKSSVFNKRVIIY